MQTKTKTVTVKQASQTVNLMATNFMNSKEIDEDLLEIFTAGITSEVTLHIRDYVLGMPLDFGVEFMINFAEAIVEKTPEQESYAIKTILSAFYYEALESEKAKKLISEALSIKPNYSLAQLLARVFGAGWSVESFVEMRRELHPKVIRSIREDAEVEL